TSVLGLSPHCSQLPRVSSLSFRWIGAQGVRHRAAQCIGALALAALAARFTTAAPHQLAVTPVIEADTHYCHLHLVGAHQRHAAIHAVVVAIGAMAVVAAIVVAHLIAASLQADRGAYLQVGGLATLYRAQAALIQSAADGLRHQGTIGPGTASRLFTPGPVTIAGIVAGRCRVGAAVEMPGGTGRSRG